MVNVLFLKKGVILCAVVVDGFVCFAVRGLDLYSEDAVKDKASELVSLANNKELQPMLTYSPATSNNVNGSGSTKTRNA